MADPEHLKILKQGVKAWNKWRIENYEIEPDLSEANLSGANLCQADLSEANLSGANLCQADLSEADLIRAYIIWANLFKTNLYKANLNDANLFKADLRGADLRDAHLSVANLRQTDLCEANLSGAFLSMANLTEANLTGANLTGTNLELATFVETILEGTNISNSHIYGISAWNLKINKETEQFNLVISHRNEPIITVDNLEVAQFVYLLLNNEKIRDVISTIGEKGVLILGRFTAERKEVLDAIREKLRDLDFVPMMFDFEKPTQRDFTETIKTLAGLSRFIIADITNPKSSPLELQAIMPDYMIPFVPIIQEDEEPFAMFRDLNQKYGEWVLDLLEYDSTENLIDVLKDAVVLPALDLADKLLNKKAEAIRKRHVKNFK